MPRTVKTLPAMRETEARLLVGEDPLEEGMATYPDFLSGESRGQRRLAGYSPRGRTELDTTEGLSTHNPVR